MTVHVLMLSQDGQVTSTTKIADGLGGLPANTRVLPICARYEAWRQGHRESKREFALIVSRHLQKTDLDQNFLPGSDVCDRCGEEVRPLLFDETGLLSGISRALICSLGLFALLNLAFDAAPTDLHD